MTYHIRTASADDISLMLDWAKDEGWNPGLKDSIVFHAADPTGFFMGYLDDKPIASISAVRYSNDFGFMGFYIVKPPFRHQGYGIKIWQHAIDYLKKVKIIGLDGVVQEQEHYKQSGFQLAHRNIRYSGLISAPEQHELVNVRDIALERIVQFEKNLFPCDRSDFLTPWIANATKALAYMENNQIKGYGVLRKCHEGYKIGPLFAENSLIAEQIFLGLCNHLQNELVVLDVLEVNQEAVKIAEKYQLKPIFETARMYTHQAPNLDLKKIFGITSFELG